MTALTIPRAAIRRVWSDQSLTVTEGAALLGMSRKWLQVTAQRMGLPARQRWTGHAVAMPGLGKLWAAGMSSRALALWFGCSQRAVLKEVRALGLVPRGRGGRGCTSAQLQCLAAVARAECAAVAAAQAEHWVEVKSRRRVP